MLAARTALDVWTLRNWIQTDPLPTGPRRADVFPHVLRAVELPISTRRRVEELPENDEL